MQPDTNLFVAIAWVMKSELRFFKLFPEVIHVDTTSHSSCEKYHLLTFSCQTSVGKQVIFLRMWIPNQKRSTFKWVFSHVLKSLIDESYFQQTAIIIADRDPQQSSEIELAINSYIKNAT